MTMFRTALLRSALRTAARPASAAASARPALFAGRAAPILPALHHQPHAAAGRLTAIRMYSAGGSLNKQEVEGRIMSLLQGFDKVNDAAKITPTAHFANDLGLDSLDTVEVCLAIEEEFSLEIPDKDADSIHSVDKAVEYILSQPDAQ
ncbi:Acyl carrier protein-like protein [Moelleriella libera RCEF 2490]|uniref:Acyl carrier protein n=1 Tax=Moelleriella libera RCEF 2490 TaxID=1081109 RepID=A0A162IHY2_9HYPO|nr:Acyl carrier protein-like protein [Moelleriella libera RCEF 2490]